ncbi:P-loop containing nucleoside triphosphate hydrolase protein [Schizophyllum fasciatum]
MSRATEAYYEHKARSQQTDDSDERGRQRADAVVEPSSNLLQRYSHLLDDRTATRRAIEFGEPVYDFDALGLHRPIVDAMRAAFPHVVHPTEMQARLIPAILGGKDVILKDDTGTGKTFATMLALLSKPRVKYCTKNAQGRPVEKDTVTSLLIVPYRDLAYQILSWVERIVAHFGGAAPPALASIAQVLVRDGQTHLGPGLAALRHTPPHILIGTPQALLDVHRADAHALRRAALSTVVVDEVDYLVETVRDLGPRQSGKRRALERRIRRHPGPTRELLDAVFAERMRANAALAEDEGEGEGASTRERIGGPQLVLASATLPGHLSAYVFGESGWFARHGYVRVAKSREEGQSEVKSMGLGHGGAGVEHSVILVGPHGATNIPDAAPSARASELPSDMPDEEQVLDDDVLSKEDRQGEIELKAVCKSPYNPDVMEAVATAFALDVPSVALLVVPTSANVKRAVYDLRELGVNARPLDLAQQRALLTETQEAKSNPVMLVSTLAAIRGLDLPDLTHVFILGVLEGEIVPRATDAYVHIAGRVGRSGRGGRVVSFVEATEVDGAAYDPEAAPEAKAAARQGDLWRLQRVLKRLSLVPRAFPHFDDVEYEGD